MGELESAMTGRRDSNWPETDRTGAFGAPPKGAHAVVGFLLCLQIGDIPPCLSRGVIPPHLSLQIASRDFLTLALGARRACSGREAPTRGRRPRGRA